MALDPSIILGVQPVQQQDPYKMYAAQAQLRDAAQQRQLQQLQIQGVQKQQDTSNAIDAALAGHQDRAAVLADLRSKGFGTAAIGLQQGWEKEDAAKLKSNLENQALFNKNAQEHVQMIGGLANSVLSAPPELQPMIYAQVRAKAIQQGVATPQDLPEQYDPQVVQGAQQQSMKASEVLAAQNAKIERDQKSVQLKQEADKNAADILLRQSEQSVQKRGQDITMRGQNMTDARDRQRPSIEAGRLQLEKQKQTIDTGGYVEAKAQQVANGDAKMLPSSRMNPVNNAVNARALELNPRLTDATYTTKQAFESPNGGPNKQITSLNKLAEHLSDLRDASKEAGFTPFGITGSGKALGIAEKLFTKEDVKFLSGAGVGTEGELNSLLGSIHSPVESIRSRAISQLETMTASAARQLDKQYTTGTGMKFDTDKFFTPHTKGLLNSGSSPSSGRVVVTAPDGSQHPFDSQAQADHFKKLAGIK